MGHSGTDDVNKRQRSFAIIATIFIGSWSEENHSFDSALFNLAARDFASRGSIFSKPWQFGSEEVTAVMVGDALLAMTAKSNRVLPIMARRALDFEQPISGKRGWAIYFSAQFYSNANTLGQVNDIKRRIRRDVGRRAIVTNMRFS